MNRGVAEVWAGACGILGCHPGRTGQDERVLLVVIIAKGEMRHDIEHFMLELKFLMSRKMADY